jgi:hypothetical protein
MKTVEKMVEAMADAPVAEMVEAMADTPVVEMAEFHVKE